MSKGRLEAFSDGVIAILITIMVLELRPPEGTDLAALAPLAPVFLSYVLSFTTWGSTGTTTTTRSRPRRSWTAASCGRTCTSSSGSRSSPSRRHGWARTGSRRPHRGLRRGPAPRRDRVHAPAPRAHRGAGPAARPGGRDRARPEGARRRWRSTPSRSRSHSSRRSSRSRSSWRSRGSGSSRTAGSSASSRADGARPRCPRPLPGEGPRCSVAAGRRPAGGGGQAASWSATCFLPTVIVQDAVQEARRRRAPTTQL